jgi:hypothetical protein
VFQLRLDTIQRFLQLVILELNLGGRIAVQHLARGAGFLVLFAFLVGERDFITGIGADAPFIRVLRIGKRFMFLPLTDSKSRLEASTCPRRLAAG